jgi:hypothetical protein
MTAVNPVRIRLTGTHTDVTAALTVLEQVFTLAAVSEPYPARSASHPGVLVYAVISRRFPLTGGTHR